MPASAAASSAVGRDAEMLAVERLLTTVESGPTMLLLEGEAGIGKTTIWREAVSSAKERGWTVLKCRPAQSEAKLSFSGLADLLASVPERAFTELVASQRHAIEVALLRVEPSGRAPDRRLVATALLALLRGLAKEGKLLLAVDDVQWLDHPSAASLEYVFRRLDDEPIAAFLAARPGVDRSALAAAFPDERVQRLVLQPLSVAVLHRIVAEGRRPPRAPNARASLTCSGW